MDPLHIKTVSPFCDLFPVSEAMVSTIAESIRVDGFDPAQPIVLWEGRGCVVDGHQRLKASIAAPISNVPVAWRKFADESEALQYAIARQRDRRNLTAADILRCVEAVEKLRAGDNQHTKVVSRDTTSSAAELAELTGKSIPTIKRARTIADHATPETRELVESGKMGIKTAYEKTQAERRFAEAFDALADGDRKAFALAVAGGRAEETAEGVAAWLAARVHMESAGSGEVDDTPVSHPPAVSTMSDEESAFVTALNSAIAKLTSLATLYAARDAINAKIAELETP